jgi:predicted alpha/beta-fold hydrolase
MDRAFPCITPVSRSSELTYTPAWWVPGAHLQTLWGKFFRRVPVVPTRLERWETPDGDEVEVHRLDASHDALDAPRLVVLHGLEGTIGSHYLQGILSQAQVRGWAADVLIFRGCGSRMNRTRRMYHSGETTDVDFVVRNLIAQRPDQTIVVAGFSLGGNVLLKWLGEQGEALPGQVVGAAAVSVPYDLERGARHIERGFSSVYTRHFLRTLKRKATAKLDGHPGAFDADAMHRSTTLFEFDDAVTAPLHGFAGAHDYYSRSSSRHFLLGIRRPTLLLSSFDDPFLPPDVLHDVALVAQSNAAITAEFHELGGHVGFVSGSWPRDERYYGEERAIEFLAHQVEASRREIPLSVNHSSR